MNKRDWMWIGVIAALSAGVGEATNAPIVRIIALLAWIVAFFGMGRSTK